MKKCPNCKGTNVSEIPWGYPSREFLERSVGENDDPFVKISAIIPLVAFRQIRKYPVVVIGLLPLGLGHFFNAGIETIFYQTYMQDSVIWGMIMGLFAFLMFIGLATKYAKKEVNLH